MNAGSGDNRTVGAEPDSPPITVVIPCFEQAEYLMEAVASVAAQTRTACEAIIVDDGSPDDTAAVAAAAIERFGDRIRLLRQSNQGVAAARNAGVQAARGAYIVPLDADDRLHPEFLARTAELLDSDPTVGVAYTDYELFGTTNQIVHVPAFDLDGLCRGNRILNTAMYRIEAWQAVGGYNPNLSLAFEDWDFWLGCAEHGFTPRHVAGVLLSYRIRPGTRNDRAPRERRGMRAQVEANHPRLFTPRRRIVRRVRRIPMNVQRRVLRFLSTISGDRFAAPPERW
jgi:glycosyltransferase involved in cell wall biosynthesis